MTPAATTLILGLLALAAGIARHDTTHVRIGAAALPAAVLGLVVSRVMEDE